MTIHKQIADASYWRKAYEDLVDQTGRDLNDGLGIDPRRKDCPARSGRAAQALRQEPDVPSVEEVAKALGAADGVTWDGRTVSFTSVGDDDRSPVDRYTRQAQAILDLFRRRGR